MLSQTPILDLEAPLPARAKHSHTDLRWWQTQLILSGIFLVAPGIAVLFVLHPNPFILGLLETLGRWFPLGKVLDSINPHLLPVFALAWLLVFFLPTVLHEAVHALAGVAVGFTPQMLGMGLLRVAFQGAKVRLRVLRSSDLAGFCQVRVPTITGVHQKYLFYLGTAPLANLVVGGSILVVWCLGLFGGLATSVKALLLGFCFLSILSGLTSLAPARLRNGLYTDGARLWMIATNSPKCRRWLSVLALGIERAKGTPVKRLNRRWLRDACSIDDGSAEDFAGHWLAYLSAEANDDAEAAIHLEACLRNAAIASDELLDRMRAMASVFHAWRTRDAVKAENWFDAIGDLGSMPRLLQIRTLVGLRVVRKRKDDALAAWDAGLAVIKGYPPAQSEPLEKSWTEWKAEILQRFTAVDEAVQPASTSSAS